MLNWLLYDFDTFKHLILEKNGFHFICLVNPVSFSVAWKKANKKAVWVNENEQIDFV